MAGIKKQIDILAAAAMLALLSVASPALAQNPRPIDIDDDPVETPFDPTGCRKSQHSPSIYNPHDEVTKNNANHSSLACALRHVSEGGEVIVYRQRQGFLPSFEVKQRNVHIRAAGDNVIVKQPVDGSCVVINPKGKDFADITTIIEGFTFVAAPNATSPCIDVQNGRLRLVNSQILMPPSPNAVEDLPPTAIKVSPTSVLEFVGRNNGIDGISASGNVNSNRQAIGVDVDFDASSLLLQGVEFRGLRHAVRSRANKNEFTSANFIDNDVAITIDDDAFVPTRAPSLLIKSGEFIRNGDAIVLEAGYTSLGEIDPDRSSIQAFDGAVTIGQAEGDKVVFNKNDRSINMVFAYPNGGFLVENTDFKRSRDVAIKMALPDDMPATIRNSRFTANKKIIDFEDTMEGDFTFEQTKFTGTKTGAVFNGKGSVDVDGGSVKGKRAAFVFGPKWRGKATIDVTEATLRNLLQYEAEHRICGYNLKSKGDRANFAKALEKIGRRVNVASISYTDLLGAADGMSRKELQYAQNAVCGRLPADAGDNADDEDEDDEDE